MIVRYLLLGLTSIILAHLFNTPLKARKKTMNKYNQFFLQLFRQQRPFLLFFAAFLCCGGILLFFIEKGELILYLNARSSPFFDLFFRIITKFGEAILYAIALILLLYHRRYVYAAAIPILAILVTIISYTAKSYFAHYRPATFFKEEGIVDQLVFVEGIYINKGASSFPSGHTMSAFAICLFIALAFPNRKYLSGSLFVLAFLVAFSRIYLVQHFFEDVYLGAIIGVLLAILVYALTAYFLQKKPNLK